MTYKSFNSELFHRFPGLKALNEKEFSYYGDEEPGCYLVFEDLLVPEINTAASTDSEYLGRLMDFVEEVALSDNSCRDLVQIGLGEWIVSSPNRQVIEALAGSETQQAIWRAERYFVAGERSQNGSPLMSLFRRLVLPKRKKG